ncbi:MAG: CAP domain-containing protein [Lapillicoccus sp.]
MIALINGQRAAAGIGPVSAQSCPDSFAEPWSPQMAAAGGLSHQSLSPFLSRCGAHAAAENVGMTGNVPPGDMMALFMGSAPHRATILNPALTGVGVGAYQDSRGSWWVTQDFIG